MDWDKNKEREEPCGAEDGTEQSGPAPCVVQVRFSDCGRTLAYYNNRFELNVGDLVFVDGKLEGQRGRVTEVNRAFHIRLADYKRVIGKADTRVSGTFLLANSHLVTLAPEVLPYAQALSWYKAPRKPEDEYITGSDDTRFALDEWDKLPISDGTIHRGIEYYQQNKVRYLCVDGGHGHAIVEGTKIYEVEFSYLSGQIGNLVCDCYCGGICKHKLAVLLQLKELLNWAKQNGHMTHETELRFAAVEKAAFFSFVIDGKRTGKLTIGDDK